MSIHYAETKYGFEYGAAEIERQAHRDGIVWIGLKTPKAKLQVYVTKTGCVRIYDEKKGRTLK